MHNVRPDKQTTDQAVQTRIFIRSITDRPDQPYIALSNRHCQTIITTEPDNSIHTISALFQFLPQQVIDKGGVREIPLPRAALLQWRLPLVSHEQIEQEQERYRETSLLTDKDISTNTKSALKKRSEDITLGEWDALLGFSHLHMMADELFDKETQTNFTVRPHVLGEEQVAHLAKETSLQTSLTFDPDASITAIQPVLTNEVDHFHEYIAIITPKQYHPSLEEDVHAEKKDPVVEPTIIPIKDKFKIRGSANASCECPLNNATTNYKSPPSNAGVQQKNEINKKPTTFDEFIDMLLSDLVDKSMPQEVKEALYQEIAEKTAKAPQDSEAETMQTNSPEEYANETVIPNQTDDEAFEKVVSQIMNSCVYNIEDQLKRIVETFDTYQKDLKYMNNQLDNIQVNKQSERPYSPQEAPQQHPQNNRSAGEDVAAPPTGMHGDFPGNVHREVDVLCECCNLTAGGAAVPTLDNSPVTGEKSAVTFDIILDSNGINVQKNSCNLPPTGEQVIRFSIVPSQPYVNQQGASAANPLQTNAFEIHVSRPHIPIPETKLHNDLHWNNLGTGPEYECIVVFPPNKIMRTSEENLNINGTSQKIGMMFEQDADCVEPYIDNVEDTTIPVNMLEPPNKSKNVKKVIKNIVPEENENFTTSMEIPWELITLQVELVDAEEERKNGCSVDNIDRLCTRKSCPMAMPHKNNDKGLQHAVEFDNKNAEIIIENNTEKDNNEPSVSNKNLITASTSEINGSLLEAFIKDEQDQQPEARKAARLPSVDSFVYDQKIERHNEPYMEYMYNHFPDDYMDGSCGSKTELPWELLTLPTNAKIRKIKKPMCIGFLNKTDKPFDSISQCTRNTFMMHNLDNACNAQHKKQQEELLSVFGVNYGAEVVSNVFPIDGRAASHKSTSIYSAISDYRYSAKRCPKNYTIGINFGDGTVSTIIVESEIFEIAHDRDDQVLSNYTIEIKPITQCMHESEMHNIIKCREEDMVGIVAKNSNMPAETQSLRSGFRPYPNTTKFQYHSMPEIPSRGTVVFPRYPVSGTASPPCVGQKSNQPNLSYKGNIDPITTALDAYRAEMKPLREALDRLKEEVRELNIPQLSPNYYNGYPAATQQQYPTSCMTYPGPVVRHTTAVSNGCGTRTSTRMKPLFLQNIVGSQYNQSPYSPVQPSPGMPPMPYYLPSQQYPPVPYPVPGMVPYPHPPINQQPSDFYSHHEYTPINPPSCKSRRRKKNRNKEGSIASKDSQISAQSNCKGSCRAAKNKNRVEDNIQTHYAPKEFVDDSSEVSVKANCYVINNQYKIEIAPDQAPIVKKEVTTTEAVPPVNQAASETYTDALMQPASSQHEEEEAPETPEQE